MKKDKTILAVETALGQGSISLLKNGKIIGWRLGKSQVSRSADLVLEIAGLLKASRIRKQEIDLISISTGPGSFTGVRIGLATVRALAFSIGCPCVGMSVCEALAFAAPEYSRVSVLLSAGRERFYRQFFVFESGRKTVESEVSVSDLKTLAKELIRYTPERLIIEEAHAPEIRSFLRDKSFDIPVRSVSENLSEFIGLASLSGETPPETGEFIISPLYVREERK